MNPAHISVRESLVSFSFILFNSNALMQICAVGGGGGGGGGSALICAITLPHKLPFILLASVHEAD